MDLELSKLVSKKQINCHMSENFCQKDRLLTRQPGPGYIGPVVGSNKDLEPLKFSEASNLEPSMYYVRNHRGGHDCPLCTHLLLSVIFFLLFFILTGKDRYFWYDEI